MRAIHSPSQESAKPPVDSVSLLLSGIPPFRGRGRLAEALARFWCRMGNREAVCSPWRGARLAVDLHDRIQRQMWGGCYEPHVRKCLAALLGPGDVFIDVGAHVGYHSVVGAALVGSTGRVFAFEPDPNLYEGLLRNTQQFPWAQAYPRAVWRKSDTLCFERSSTAGEAGWGALTAVRDLGRGEHIPVQAVSLDDWTEEAGFDRLRAIKLDAEGSEPAVLEGARSVLQRFQPLIILEINEVLLRQAGSSGRALAQRLLAHGYTLFRLSWRKLEPLASQPTAALAEVLCIPSPTLQTALRDLHRGGFKLREPSLSKSSALRKRLGQAAQETMRRYTWGQIARKVENVFESAAQRPREGRLA